MDKNRGLMKKLHYVLTHYGTSNVCEKNSIFEETLSTSSETKRENCLQTTLQSEHNSHLIPIVDN